VLEAKGEIGRAKDVYNKAVALDPHRWETTLAFAHFQTRAYPQNLVASERVPSVCAIDCLWVCVLLCVRARVLACACVRACMRACVRACVQNDRQLLIHTCRSCGMSGNTSATRGVRACACACILLRVKYACVRALGYSYFSKPLLLATTAPPTRGRATADSFNACCRFVFTYTHEQILFQDKVWCVPYPLVE